MSEKSALLPVQAACEPAVSGRLTYTVAQTAAILGIGERLTYALVRRGDLPALRLGRRWVIPRGALDEFLAVASPERSTL